MTYTVRYQRSGVKPQPNNPGIGDFMRFEKATKQTTTVILVSLLGAVFFFQGCATFTAPQMTAVASSNQKVGYDGTITSRKKHFVALSPYSKLDDAVPVIGFAKEKQKFMLTVRNLGDSPISIGPASVSAAVVDAASAGKHIPIRIQTLEEFLADFETEYYDGEKKYIYNTVSKIWNLVKYGGMSAERATDRMYDFKIDLESMRRQKKVLLKMLPDTFLADRNILPAGSYTGIVVCDTRTLAPEIVGDFKVSVSVDNEEYNFKFHGDLAR
jgi:hypothetical protein